MSIKINVLEKYYNSNKVLDIRNLEIKQGILYSLVGNNGAGKTTLLRIILDIVEANLGNVYIDGIDTKKSDEWKVLTGSFLDENFLIPFLRPLEYLKFVAKCYKVEDSLLKKIIEDYMFFVPFINEKKNIRDFSTGNKRKIGIIASILMKPKYLIIDEPFVNLDVTSQFQLKNILKDLKNNSTTILITSHDLNIVTEISDMVGIIELGSIVKEEIVTSNTLDELKKYFTYK